MYFNRSVFLKVEYKCEMVTGGRLREMQKVRAVENAGTLEMGLRQSGGAPLGFIIIIMISFFFDTSSPQRSLSLSLLHTTINHNQSIDSLLLTIGIQYKMVSFQYLPIFLLAATFLVLDLRSSVEAFAPDPACSKKPLLLGSRIVQLRETESEEDAAAKEATRLSLEEKMANWEATEEEIKAATLGGVVPERSDSFDVGLYVAFPFMVAGCLLFLAFPFIAANIDVSSVGPPPAN